jgi:hypothetical protein
MQKKSDLRTGTPILGERVMMNNFEGFPYNVLNATVRGDEKIRGRFMPQKKHICLTALALALAVGGCATTQAPSNPAAHEGAAPVAPPPPPPPPPVTASAPEASAAPVANAEAAPPPPTGSASVVQQRYADVDVTPYSNFSDEWVKDLSTSTGGTFSGLYTRLLIRCATTCSPPTGSESSESETQKSNSLPYHSRFWLERFFLGKEYAVNLTLGISAGLFKATVPIVTLDHKSNSDVGEQWSRTVKHTLGDYPLFLVGSGSDTPEITFELKGSLNYTSSFAADAIDATVAVAKDISPQSSFVTTLSAPAIATQAQAVDTAIGKLLGKGIDETNGNQDPIRYWHVNQGIVITMLVPRDENDFNTEGNWNPYIVGSWRISFEEPRPSIFADWRICEPTEYGGWKADSTPRSLGTNLNLRCADSLLDATNAVYGEINASDVLKTPLANFSSAGTTAASLSTLSAYLSQQTWYKTALGQLGGTKATATDAKNAAAGFCLNIANAISTAGLNGVDQGIAIWAIAENSTDISTTGRTAINADQTCKTYITPILNARPPVASASGKPAKTPTVKKAASAAHKTSKGAAHKAPA